MPASILVLGATGLIGSPFTKQLFKSRFIKKVVVLVRSKAKAQLLFPGSDSRLEIVEGDVKTDAGRALITELSASADVVFDGVDSLDSLVTAAAIQGLTKRYESTGEVGKLIHLSGTANFATDAPGGKIDESQRREVNDSDENLISLIPQGVNGVADHLLIDADKSGKIASYIIAPVGIYGGTGDSLGLFLRWYVGAVSAIKKAAYLGEGQAHFHMIHMDDVVSLAVKVLEFSLTTKEVPPVHKRYYIASGTRYTWKELAEAAAPHFKNTGLVESAQAEPIEASLLGQTPAEQAIGWLWTTNTEVIGTNAKGQLGWTRTGAPSFKDSLQDSLKGFSP